MAIAGPIVSAVLAASFSCGDSRQSSRLAGPLVLFFLNLAGINLTVLIFNLVPAFPLDGGRVLRSIIWGASAMCGGPLLASVLGRGFAWILICLAFCCSSSRTSGRHMMALIGVFSITLPRAATSKSSFARSSRRTDTAVS